MEREWTVTGVRMVQGRNDAGTSRERGQGIRQGGTDCGLGRGLGPREKETVSKGQERVQER